MKRIQAGPVRGISLKLQEEERERREAFIPEVSVMETMTQNIKIDADTKALLQAMGLGNLAGVETSEHHGRR